MVCGFGLNKQRVVSYTSTELRQVFVGIFLTVQVRQTKQLHFYLEIDEQVPRFSLILLYLWGPSILSSFEGNSLQD